MGEYKTIVYEADTRGVATITLARPDKHNALSAAMIAELTDVTSRITDDKSVRACVLQAQGQTFCAGGDLGWMKAHMEMSRKEKMAGARQLVQMFRALDELPCLLIGKINGPAYGGGIGLMSVCDVAIATTQARFALTETRLGLIAATIGPYVLRRIGEAWSRQYFFSAKPFDGKTAMRMNLVSQVVDSDELDAAVELEIDNILKCLPGAVADAKTFVRELARNPAMDIEEFTAGKLADRWETREAKEAVAAFFAARK